MSDDIQYAKVPRRSLVATLGNGTLEVVVGDCLIFVLRSPDEDMHEARIELKDAAPLAAHLHDLFLSGAEQERATTERRLRAAIFGQLLVIREACESGDLAAIDEACRDIAWCLHAAPAAEPSTKGERAGAV